MFPLRDNNPRHGKPVVTVALIALNALVFLYALSLPEEVLEELFYRWGFVPARLLLGNETTALGFLPDGWTTPLTSMFLHAGWAHLLGNMWMLWLFGDNVEDRFGHLRFLAFYVLCGLAAAWTHFLIGPHSAVPTVGASGAVAGVMGAYLLLFPRARIVTLVWFLFVFDFVEIPAIVFLGLWIAVQVWSGSMTLTMPESAGVAFWAHVGGFAAGAALLFPMLRGRPVPPSALWRRRRW